MSLFQNEEFFKQNPFHNIDSPLPLGFPQFFSIPFKIKGRECVHSVQKGSSYRCLKWFNDFSFVLYSFPNSFKHCLFFSYYHTKTDKFVEICTISRSHCTVVMVKMLTTFLYVKLRLYLACTWLYMWSCLKSSLIDNLFWY